MTLDKFKEASILINESQKSAQEYKKRLIDGVSRAIGSMQSQLIPLQENIQTAFGVIYHSMTIDEVVKDHSKNPDYLQGERNLKDFVSEKRFAIPLMVSEPSMSRLVLREEKKDLIVAREDETYQDSIFLRWSEVYPGHWELDSEDLPQNAAKLIVERDIYSNHIGIKLTEKLIVTHQEEWQKIVEEQLEKAAKFFGAEI